MVGTGETDCRDSLLTNSMQTLWGVSVKSHTDHRKKRSSDVITNQWGLECVCVCV